MSFEDRNYLVVGGRAGIGGATREELTANGAKVWNISRQPLETQASGVVHSSHIDITSATVDEITGNLPEKLHGLVYCPGSITLKPFQSLKREDFQSDLEINLLGAVKVLQATMRRLKAADGASVVLFSTVATGAGMKYHASITAAKSAVEGLAISLASEWADYKIRVNVVAPSLTDTSLAARLLSDDKRRSAAADRHPIKGIGTTVDMAAAVLFLLDPDSRWITGQVLRVDGGMSGLRPL